MNEEIDDYQPKFVKMPDFNQMIAQKLSPSPSTSNNTGFDPHKLMVNKKKSEDSMEMPVIHQWPENEVQALEDFCKQHGLVGISCGRMSPIAALAMLKNKMGIIDTTPLEQRYDIENKKSLLKG